jgi:hypothetical protein
MAILTGSGFAAVAGGAASAGGLSTGADGTLAKEGAAIISDISNRGRVKELRTRCPSAGKAEFFVVIQGLTGCFATSKTPQNGEQKTACQCLNHDSDILNHLSLMQYQYLKL